MNTFIDYIAENIGAIGQRTLEHVGMVAVAVAAATVLGIGLGILLSRNGLKPVRGVIFYILGLGQTIPSLAILALAMGVLGIGAFPAIVALLAYSVLPIARNTFTGIQGVPGGVTDAARGMGMTPGQILFRVELPLAMPFVMAGVRTATVFAISAAALAYLIGGGGLGDFIFTGIALFKPEAMLAGAIPTAALALIADALLKRVSAQSDRRG